MPTQVVNDSHSSNTEIKVKTAYNGEIMITYINENISYDELCNEIRGICRFSPDQVKRIIFTFYYFIRLVFWIFIAFDLLFCWNFNNFFYRVNWRFYASTIFFSSIEYLIPFYTCILRMMLKYPLEYNFNLNVNFLICDWWHFRFLFLSTIEFSFVF